MELIEGSAGETNQSIWQPVAGYVARCKDIMTEPTAFFRSLRTYTAPLSHVLPFGLVTLWLATLINFVWSLTTNLFFAKVAQQISEDFYGGEAVTATSMFGKEVVFAAGSVVASPFLGIISLFFSALVLNLLGRWVMPKRHFFSYSLRNIMLILNYAMVGMWFSVVPIFGGLLSFVAVQVYTIIGFRECFHISTRRASFVVLLPYILSLATLMLLGLIVSLLVFVGLYAAILGVLQAAFV